MRFYDTDIMCPDCGLRRVEVTALKVPGLDSRPWHVCGECPCGFYIDAGRLDSSYQAPAAVERAIKDYMDGLGFINRWDEP